MNYFSFRFSLSLGLSFSFRFSFLVCIPCRLKRELQFLQQKIEKIQENCSCQKLSTSTKSNHIYNINNHDKNEFHERFNQQCIPIDVNPDHLSLQGKFKHSSTNSYSRSHAEKFPSDGSLKSILFSLSCTNDDNKSVRAVRNNDKCMRTTSSFKNKPIRKLSTQSLNVERLHTGCSLSRSNSGSLKSSKLPSFSIYSERKSNSKVSSLDIFLFI